MRIAGCIIEKEKMKVIEKTLAESNVLLDNYYSKVTVSKGRQGCQTRQNKKLARAKYLSELFCEYKKNPSADVCLHSLVVPNYDLIKIVRTKQLESEIVESFVGLVYDIVSKKEKLTKDIMLSKEDLEAECFNKILSALCSYRDSNVYLSTYIYHCICKHIYNLCNKTNSLSKLSTKAINLKRKYVETKKSLLRSSNFEEIVEIMKISEKEIDLLRSALVARSDHFSEPENIENYEIKNYEEENNISVKSFSLVDIEGIELSDLEKAVLDGFMQSANKKGLSSISKNIINPKTGKPYTRMAASLAWKRVQEKFKNKKGAA